MRVRIYAIICLLMVYFIEGRGDLLKCNWETEHVCDCKCVPKSVPCNQKTCPYGYWLCERKCIPYSQPCKESCVNGLYLPCAGLHNTTDCLLEAERQKCGPVCIRENHTCFASCNTCPHSHMSYKLHCYQLGVNLRLCYDSNGNIIFHEDFYTCGNRCVSVDRPCINSESGLAFCQYGRRHCDNPHRCLTFWQVCDQSCGKGWLYCKDCSCCRSKEDYHMCFGECLHWTLPCNGLCMAGLKQCNYQGCELFKNTTVCARNDTPCPSCRPSQRLCENVCIPDNIPCRDRCKDGFYQCGNVCISDINKPHFYHCFGVCLSSNRSCRGTCNMASNLTDLCADECHHPSDKFWICEERCIPASQSCFDKCQNALYRPCKSSITNLIACLTDSEPCRGQCLPDRWLCKNVCIPMNASCSGMCNPSSDHSQLCGGECHKPTDAVWECKGRCQSLAIPCGEECGFKDLITCNETNKLLCQPRFMPCNGNCAEFMDRCGNICIPTDQPCEGRCQNDSMRICRGRCQLKVLPCGTSCPQPLQFCNGLCGMDACIPCQDGYYRCEGVCVSKRVQCKGQCFTFWRECQGKCINSWQSCDGECPKTHRICGTDCLPIQEGCNGKCQYAYDWLCGRWCQNKAIPCGETCPQNLKFCRGSCVEATQKCSECPHGEYLCYTSCISNRRPCSGKCQVNMEKCQNRCIYPNEPCVMNCPASHWPCHGRCQLRSIPCDKTCPKGLVLCKGVCSEGPCESCPDGFIPCHGVCQPNEEKCAGKCVESMHLCSDRCIPKEQPCQGLCAPLMWLCKSICIPRLSPCNAKCHLAYVLCEDHCNHYSVGCNGQCTPGYTLDKDTEKCVPSSSSTTHYYLSLSIFSITVFNKMLL